MSEYTTTDTYLFHSTTSEGPFTKLCDIKDYPDIFQPAEKLERSSLSSNQKKYEKGMKDTGDHVFTANYDFEDYKTIKLIADKDTNEYYQLRFGSNGEYGAWQWSGGLDITPTGAGLNAIREMKITTFIEDDIVDVTISA
jgi:hypothetical protein